MVFKIALLASAPLREASLPYLKVRQCYKLIYSRLDICSRYLLHPCRPELLYTERCHCRPNDNRGFHTLKRSIINTGKITDKATGKGVASASWVKYILKRQRGRSKYLVAVK